MKEQVSTQIRMPGRLHHHLARAATKSGRSLNAEIVWRLEQSLKIEYGRDAEEVAALLDWVARKREEER